jgi:hypothetical protein
MRKIMQILLGIVAIILVFLVVLTTLTQHSSYQKQFAAGTVPNPTPDGFLKGLTDFYQAGWQGKKVDAATANGINVFSDGNGVVEKFPFKTYVGKGLQDKNLDVFKIDYAGTASPWYARPILDEIVEIAPGKYLGKISYRLIPGYPFALWYFKLEK